jgi:glucokinase
MRPHELSLVIEAAELQASFGFQSELLNDFAAVANSLPLLGPADLAKLGGVVSDKTPPMAVLGLGYWARCGMPDPSG